MFCLRVQFEGYIAIIGVSSDCLEVSEKDSPKCDSSRFADTTHVHFRKAINEAPKPFKVAFRDPYLKAIEEYEKGLETNLAKWRWTKQLTPVSRDFMMTLNVGGRMHNCGLKTQTRVENLMAFTDSAPLNSIDVMEVQIIKIQQTRAQFIWTFYGVADDKYFFHNKIKLWTFY